MRLVEEKKKIDREQIVQLQLHERAKNRKRMSADVKIRRHRRDSEHLTIPVFNAASFASIARTS